MRIRIARATSTAAAGCACALLLAACGGSPGPSGSSGSSVPGKNGDAPPTALSGLAGAQRHPVPRGTGSHTPDDFNGDGHRDLVLNHLVKPAADAHGDDAGIGIVYGAASRGLDPSVRQLLSAHANAAKIGDTLPSAFDAEASCDLDRDGFTDLVLATDPRTTASGARPYRCRSSSAPPRASPARRSRSASRTGPASATSGQTTRSAATSTGTGSPIWR